MWSRAHGSTLRFHETKPVSPRVPDFPAVPGLNFSKVTQDSSTVSVLTWNVKQQEAVMQLSDAEERIARSCDLITQCCPDFICLQKAGAAFIQKLQSLLQDDYDMKHSPELDSLNPYTTLILVKKEFKATFNVHDFKKSQFHRKLLVADCVVQGVPLVVATAQLDDTIDTNAEKVQATRITQMQLASRVLAGKQSIFCGDFAFESETVVGSMNDEQLARCLPQFVDLWPQLHPGQPGYTFDTEQTPSNKLLPYNNERSGPEQRRCDRVLMSRNGALTAQRMELVAAKDMGGMYLSDHAGILTHCKVQTDWVSPRDSPRDAPSPVPGQLHPSLPMATPPSTPKRMPATALIRYCVHSMPMLVTSHVWP